MMKLLSANFFSMLHTKRLWLGAAFMAFFAGVGEFTIRREMAQGLYKEATLDDPFLSFAPMLFILLPIVCGLFINTDYHDGTIRNKITVGRTRSSVYLSNLLIVWLVEIFYTVIHVAVVLIGGVGIGFDNLPSVALRSALLLLTIAALAAIATFIATIMTGRYALVLCALLAIGMMFGSQIINEMMTSPDMIPDIEDIVYISGEDGVMTPIYTDSDGNTHDYDDDDIPMKPNPHYIREPLRSILRTYNNISPGGQIWEIINRGHEEWDIETQQQVVNETPYWQLTLYSVCVTAGFTALGLVLFRRKDLK